MKINEKFALFYGIMLGDGCISKIGSCSFISISCNFHSDRPFVKRILPLLTEIRGKKVKAYDRIKYGKIEIIFSDKPLFNHLKKLGFPVGKKGPTLSILKEFKFYMKQVTQGFLATDGCVIVINNNETVYPRIEFSSISKQLLEQFRSYIISCGINCNVYLSHKKNSKWHPKYRLQINGKKNLVAFKEKIGFINPKHQQKYEDYINNRIVIEMFKKETEG